MRETRKVPEFFAETLSRYEDTRERIYRELEIKYVQQTVRNKILRKNSSGVELLFYRDADEDDTDAFITDDATAELDSTSSRHSDLALSEANDNPQSCTEKRTGMRNSTVSRYLSLEAECSGEEQEEDPDEVDLDGLIDDSCDDSIELSKFVQERSERDDRILRSLRKRFAGLERKPSQSSAEMAQIDCMLPDSSGEFPEIPEMGFGTEECHPQDVQKRRNLDPVCERGMFYKDEALFSNELSALERLSKREEEKNASFFEQKDM